MNKHTIIKISFFIIAIVLIAVDGGYWSQCRLAENVKKDVAMGRYNRAFESLEGVKGSVLYRISKYFDKEDPYVAYKHRGCIDADGGYQEGGGQNSSRLPGQTTKQLKRMPSINRANIIATNMDFITAAEEYSKVLRIDPDDFEAKKNLERMRLGKSSYRRCFLRLSRRERKGFSLWKLIPWG